MPIQQLDVSRALDVQAPLATMGQLAQQQSREKAESALRLQEGALTVEKMRADIQKAKQQADEDVQIKQIVAQGGDPQAVYQKLLAVNPDKARAYLTNAQADMAGARTEAIERAKMLQGQETPPSPVGAPGQMQTPPSAEQPPRTVAGVQVAAPVAQNAPIAAGYMGNEQIPPVEVPGVYGPATTLQPQSARQLTLRDRAKAQFDADLAMRAKIAEAAATAQVKMQEPVKLAEGEVLKVPATGRLLAEGNPKTEKPSEFTQTLDDFNKNPGLTAKYGTGPVAFDKYRQDQKIATAIAGRPEPPALTDAGIDAAAMLFAKTGQMPAGLGRNGIQQTKIINRAGELAPNLDVASNKADFEANKKSLDQIVRLNDALTSFENTANKNMSILEASAPKILDTGSPWINQPLRKVDEKLLGNTELPVFRAARQIVVNEVAKLTGNPGLTGQLSDAARHEIEDLLPPDMTMAQFLKLLPTFKQDMANRTSSLAQQIDAIKGRIKGGGTPAPASSLDDEIMKAIKGK